MKIDLNKLTLWTCFLKPDPTEQEIQEAANRMKGGKGYLFKDNEGLLEMYNKRRIGDFAARNKTFVKRVLATV